MPSTWNSSKFFVPARDSRHRAACLALYRALLKASPKVPLPDDLATAWGTKRQPIANVIRRAFLKNRADTSTRLVYPALQAGYRMLDTLTRATDPKTPEHASILAFLEKRLADRNHVLHQKTIHPSNSKTPPRPSSAPHPDSVPLLVNVTPAPTRSDPQPKPIYAPAIRPRPLADLPPGKKRKIPVLDMAREYPFLRLSKPQPEYLSRMLTQKLKTRTKRGELLRDWSSDDGTRIGPADCLEEDAWEDLVIDLLDQEHLCPVIDRSRTRNGPVLRPSSADDTTFMRALTEMEAWIRQYLRQGEASTYARTLHLHGVVAVSDMLDRDREHAVARANAMRRIIADEKKLAAQEKEADHLRRCKEWEARMQAKHGDG